MYLSTSLVDEVAINVDIRPATTYENRGDGYKDYPDENARWLSITYGVNKISLRVTLEQLEKLRAGLAK